MSDSEEIVDLPDEGGDDLFGDDDVEDVISERDLSEHESDQEKDYGRGAGDRSEFEQDRAEFREKTYLTVPMYRHRIPRSSDGTVCLGFIFARSPRGEHDANETTSCYHCVSQISSR